MMKGSFVVGGPLASKKKGYQWRAVVMTDSWSDLHRTLSEFGFNESPKRLRGWWCVTENPVELAKAQQEGKNVLIIKNSHDIHSKYRVATEEDT